MSATDRILKGIRDVLRLQDRVEALADAVTRLDSAVNRQTDKLHAVELRLKRIETLVEVAERQNQAPVNAPSLEARLQRLESLLPPP